MSIYRNLVWFAKGFKEYTKAGFQEAKKSFVAEDLDVDVVDKVFMITGANSGVGRIAALEIAKRGATVHMLCRNQERGEAAQKDLKEKSGNEKIHLHLVDMSRPREVKTFADKFLTDGKSCDVLINNAGVLMPDGKRTLTQDGLEVTFATNTLGVHILTVGMLPVLEKSNDPRVIIVSSGGMLVQKLDTSDLNFEKSSNFDGQMAYAQTKRQQVVMASQYAHSYQKVMFASMHPGWADTQGVRASIPDFHRKMKDRLRSEEEGADTIVWLAISPAASALCENGLFFQDRKSVSKHLPLAWTKSRPEEEKKLIDMLDELSYRYGGS